MRENTKAGNKRESNREKNRENNRGNKKEINKNRVVENNSYDNSFEEREDIIIGRNAVLEALKTERTIETLYISNSKLEGSINAIISKAKDKKILIKEVDKRKLDSMCNNAVHQGVIARVTPYEYSEVSDILELAEKKGENPFIVF